MVFLSADQNSKAKQSISTEDKLNFEEEVDMVSMQWQSKRISVDDDLQEQQFLPISDHFGQEKHSSSMRSSSYNEEAESAFEENKNDIFTSFQHQMAPAFIKTDGMYDSPRK